MRHDLENTMGWSLRAIVAISSLMLSALPARALDRAYCNGLFGGANIDSVDTFRLDAGKVDFGDDPHLAGQPRGTAVVCWSIDGRMAFAGKVYADSIRENVMAIVRVRFRRNGTWSGEISESVFGNFAASESMRFVTDTGNQVDKVRVRLFIGDTNGNSRLLREKNFSR
jgi:hypothetical protein